MAGRLRCLPSLPCACCHSTCSVDVNVQNAEAFSVIQVSRGYGQNVSFSNEVNRGRNRSHSCGVGGPYGRYGVLANDLATWPKNRKLPASRLCEETHDSRDSRVSSVT